MHKDIGIDFSYCLSEICIPKSWQTPLSTSRSTSSASSILEFGPERTARHPRLLSLFCVGVEHPKSAAHHAQARAVLSRISRACGRVQQPTGTSTHISFSASRWYNTGTLSACTQVCCTVLVRTGTVHTTTITTVGSGGLGRSFQTQFC